jgi:putative hydrolase
MISVDFHSHSLFSGCGVHTVVEMLTEAKRLGLRGLAITDHGRLVGGRANTVFFERLSDPVPGIRLLKGIEANINGDTGRIDVGQGVLPFLDVILLGLHDNLKTGLGREWYTYALLKALVQNPYIDILSHLNSANYPVDYDAVAEAAVRLDIAVEMNNSKVAYQRVSDDETGCFIEACKKRDCKAAVCSDAHCFQELGQDGAIRALLSKYDYPEALIVNRTAESAFEFVESRKSRKRV